ncbi:CopD family protein [Lichenicoccus sp.]|uniref:CopD family protein n=1 Tax=Lichenicoccus sp. TaxID=2781899 RepID=UPI003D12770B
MTLVLARAVFVASLLSLGGTLAFGVLVAAPALARAPPVEGARMRRMLRRLTWCSLSVAVAALLTWTVLQAAEIAGTTGAPQALAALPPVLGSTSFGHLALLQLALLGATACLLRAGLLEGRAGLVAALGNVALQAGHGHAMAMDGGFSLLCAADVLHLLAAGAWIGGLLPLLLVVRFAPAATGAMAARCFSPMGRVCVAALAGSALVQGWVLVGGLPALFGRPYGWVVLVKTGLLLLLTGLALLNRYRLAPALRSAAAETGRHRLVSSILVQTGLGLLAVVAASWLSGLTPGMDMGQPPS